MAKPINELYLNQKFTIFMLKFHERKHLSEAHKSMYRHEWIVSALDDLAEYAKLNALAEVADILSKAKEPIYKEISEKGEESNVLQFPLTVLFR